MGHDGENRITFLSKNKSRPAHSLSKQATSINQSGLTNKSGNWMNLTSSGLQSSAQSPVSMRKDVTNAGDDLNPVQ